MKKIALLLFLLNVTFLFAQKDISGVVKDNSGSALPGVNIIEKGTNNGVSTDIDGAYKIKVKDGATLVFSYVGFSKLEKAATSSTINIVLSEEGGQALDEIVVTGTRTAPRSNTTTALPIDVISAKDLASTGQASFDKALQYKIPSFNTVQTPVNDATSLLDPYEIRNLGPSRTLILINGKRKNMSSLLYTQTSPGRGETGADISAIPQDAIERVEILRDGASAQYGSDAIAGVMNIILKKSTNGGSATLRTGITGKGDGEMIGISINNGSTVGDKGFVNYTVDFSKVQLANRPGILNAQDESDYWGVPLATTQAFLAKKPDGGNVNGSPETAAAKFEVNGGSDLSENSKIYYNAAYVYKKVNSFANYRAPYWRTVADMPYLASLFGNGTAASYLGYVPTFIGDLNDYNATLGYKNVTNGWNTDASVTIGGNKQIYTVTNSQNRSKDSNGNFIYAQNPNIYTGQTTFRPGGTSFNHLVGNIDISKVLTDKVSIGFGTEFRTENFEVIAGDKQSYDGMGADSFQGNDPANSGKFNRYNLGAYLDIAVDFTEDFLVNGTVRHEDYSDFGAANVWKLSSRYKFADDKFTLRGSLSTGFRAPSLHQIYTEKSQSTFSGGAIAVTGIISNVSTAARSLGVPKLTAEKSNNLTLGFGFKPTKNFNFTLDYYNIKVKDRIVLGNLVNGQAYFVNAIDSRTAGLDFVAGYRNIMLGTGKLALNLSGNYTLVNERVGSVKNPASVTALPGNQTVFNATQDALMFTSRPKFKYIFGGDYEIGKFNFSLNNTVFGPTKFKNADYSDPGLSTEFETKMVTDLGVNFNATKSLSLALNVNNIFNVIPKYKITSDGSASANAIVNNPALLHAQDMNITFDGRYNTMSYDGFHFSQLGTMFNLSLNYKF
ncbi:TonB-dependent receptor domain-containing protein [Flavobacterium sp. LB3P45]|uniref:TonB-dependent receptor domain-containing protein n=1 Tax=Flavobacterium fructosi TaxID=3230416 RepID=A0ABW6HPP2_9FLAO